MVNLKTCSDLEISCLPANLPEYIEIDLGELELGQTVHISDIKLPEGVESVALAHGSDHDSAVAKIIKPKGLAEDDEEDAAPEAEGETDAE